MDAGGNEASITRMVTVEDTTLPVLTLLGDAEIRLPVWHEFIDPWVEAHDTVDGNLSDQVVLLGQVLNYCPECMI